MGSSECGDVMAKAALKPVVLVAALGAAACQASLDRMCATAVARYGSDGSVLRCWIVRESAVRYSEGQVYWDWHRVDDPRSARVSFANERMAAAVAEAPGKGALRAAARRIGIEDPSRCEPGDKAESTFRSQSNDAGWFP